MRLRVLNDYLVVAVEYEKEVDTFLALPEKNSIVKRSPFATIMEVGIDCKNKFRKGTRVLINRWVDQKTQPFDYEGKKCRFINEDDVEAEVENAEGLCSVREEHD